MPKRTDIKSIMIIGAGPIVIGQACEFDYSGTQACKALKEEGYRVILVNSNPATIMTDPDLADATYIEPITPEIVAKIIEKERPDALLPTMGGQTALNCALSLKKMGTLDKFNVRMIGATAEAIDKALMGGEAAPPAPAAETHQCSAVGTRQQVVARRALTPEIAWLEIEAPEVSRHWKPGQFIIIRPREDSERIPLTILGGDPERGTVHLVVQGVGKTSRQVLALEAGDHVASLLGPLGQPATIEKVGHVLCVAGGVGVRIRVRVGRGFAAGVRFGGGVAGVVSRVVVAAAERAGRARRPDRPDADALHGLLLPRASPVARRDGA
jgi:hypothetical protein